MHGPRGVDRRPNSSSSHKELEATPAEIGAIYDFSTNALGLAGSGKDNLFTYHVNAPSRDIPAQLRMTLIAFNQHSLQDKDRLNRFRS
jgi:hypothetical protein